MLNRKDLLCIILISLLFIIAYSKIASFEFVNWDDDVNVYKNPVFVSETPINDIWTSFKTLSYLPVTHSFLYLQWNISPSPQFYHLNSLILQILNILLIFILLKKLKIETLSVFFITLIYAIHPIHTENIAWITEQKSLIAGIFIWLSFISFINYKEKDKIRFLYITSLFYALAMLSKQTAFPLLFVFIFYNYFILQNKKLKNIFRGIVFLGIVGIAVTSIHWIREGKHLIQSAALDIPFYSRIIISFKSFTYYILKTIIPVNFCPLYPHWILHSDFISDYLPVIFVLLLTVIIIVNYIKSKNSHSRLLIFGFLSYTFTIAPVLGIITMPYMNTSFIADRYFYFPGLFITLILVLTLKMYFKKYSYIILTIFSGICIFSTLSYSNIWKNPEVFWDYVIKNNPDEDSSYVNLSYYYIHKEEGNLANLQKAMFLANEAIHKNSNNTIAYYNYGSCLMKLGKWKESEEYFRKSLELQPDYSDVWNDLGFVQEAQGFTQNAIDCYKKAVFYVPDHKVAKNNLKRIQDNKNLQ